MIDLVCGIDPSLTGTGIVVATREFSIRVGELITAKGTLDERLNSIVYDVRTVLWTEKPGVIVIEVPALKVHGRLAGNAHGLALYGCCVGRVWQACLSWANSRPEKPLPIVVPVDAQAWTRRRPKAKRHAELRMLYPQLRGVRQGDVMDAAGLVAWWLEKEKRNESIG